MISQLRAIGGGMLSQSGRLRQWLIVFPLLAVLCPAAQGTGSDTEPAGSARLVVLQDPVKPSFALPSLDGPAHELAEHRGRIMLVHFFATWCEPCRAEMANLKQLRSRLDG